jgi:hypothetical protein
MSRLYCLIVHPYLLYILFHDDITTTIIFYELYIYIFYCFILADGVPEEHSVPTFVVYVCQLCGWFRVHAAYCIIFALYF